MRVFILCLILLAIMGGLIASIPSPGVRCNYVGNKPATRVECKGGSTATGYQMSQ